MQDGNDGPAPMTKTGLFFTRSLITLIPVVFFNNEFNNLDD